MIYISLGLIALGPIIVILFLIHYPKHLMKKEKLEPLVTKYMKLVDILILNEPFNKKTLQIFPVLKDENDNIYLQFKEYSYGNYKKEIKIEEPLQIKMISDHGKEISKNQECLVCIDKEISKVSIQDDKVIIDDIIYYYKGNVSSQNNFDTEKQNIYNLYCSDFLNRINNATLYEGIVDFDDLRKE